MSFDCGGALRGLLIMGVQVQASTFAFAGVSLSSDFRTVAARYPHSTPQDQYVSLAPEDIHDHISAIEISGSGSNRRVRVAFETLGAGGRHDYPQCAAIEAKLAAQFGRPQAIRRFHEESSPRADRIWRSQTEQLTLICFGGERGRLSAEAVEITPR